MTRPPDPNQPEPARPGAAPPGAARYDPAWLERVLWPELDPLFAHAADPNGPGFIEDLGPDWRPTGGGEKSLVFQSRMLWTVAEVVRAFPDRAAPLTAHVARGVEALEALFFDRPHGGYRWSTASGGGRKHLYGQAFALYALSNAARSAAPAAGEAHAAAARLFAWLEETARDPERGGYTEALSERGEPLAPPGEVRPGAYDQIGTPLGLRSTNAHIHALEAATEFLRATGDPAARARTAELLGLVRDRLVSPAGAIPPCFWPDWTPLPGLTSYGHDLETAYLMLDAARALGDAAEEARCWPVADRIAAHALRFGIDREHGGVFEHGAALEPASSTAKIWWAQAEAANALEVILGPRPDGVEPLETGLRAELEAAWRGVIGFSDRWLIDPEHGGWWWGSDATGRARVGGVQKATPWKAGYHTTRWLVRALGRAVGTA